MGGDSCPQCHVWAHMDKQDELSCNEFRLKRTALKKVEHLNKEFEERMQEQVHARYRKEII